MDKSFTILAVTDLPAVDSGAACDACGDVGTSAVIAWSPPARRDPQRFCRLCWPEAHRRYLQEIRIMRENADRPHFGSSARWHWSLAIGTLLRELTES